MKQVFLGKPLHWIVLVAAIALGWIAGDARLHVITFNFFLVLVLAGTILGLLTIIVTTRPGELVTRELIEDVNDPDDDADGTSQSIGK